MTSLATSREGYKQAWASRSFRVQAIATAIALPITLNLFSRFLLWVEERPGAVLEDPVLAALTPADHSNLTFTLIYGAILIGLISLLRTPRPLMRLVQAYILLLAIRTLCIWITPLDPPIGFVQLDDPVIENFGPAKPLSRDLFFSGHTSTLFLVTLACGWRWLRPLLVIATIAVAYLLLVQHAHYTVDVVVAPMVSYTAFWLAGLLGNLGRTQIPGQ